MCAEILARSARRRRLLDIVVCGPVMPVNANSLTSFRRNSPQYKFCLRMKVFIENLTYAIKSV